MTTTTQIQVWVLVDGAGDYAVGVDRDTTEERFGEVGSGGPRRPVCVKLTIPLPEPVVLTATVPAQRSDVSAVLAAA
jgi:hypothetical protein